MHTTASASEAKFIEPAREREVIANADMVVVGWAAEQSVARKLSSARDVDIREVRAKLRKMGALI
jgi:hypothetical protein